MCTKCAGWNPACTWKTQLNADATNRRCCPTHEQKPKWLNEFGEAINAGQLIVSKSAAVLEDQTVFLHDVALFGQQLGNIQDLYGRLEHLMRHFGEGRVVVMNKCGKRM